MDSVGRLGSASANADVKKKCNEVKFGMVGEEPGGAIRRSASQSCLHVDQDI